MNRKPEAATLTIRVLVGGYLLYLAWGLREAAFGDDGLLFLVAMIVFALVGGAVVLWALPPLLRNQYRHPWDVDEETEDDSKSD